VYAALSGSECVILDDPIKALDPSTAARVWEKAIKESLAGKTRVLVCNSQMLQKFASDKAVDRLIIIERDSTDGDGNGGRPGTIAYDGPPMGMPQGLRDRLGDGYQMQQDESEKTPDLQVFGAPDAPAQPEPGTEADAETETPATVQPKPKPAPAAPPAKVKFTALTQTLGQL
jgi:hypothetical protein